MPEGLSPELQTTIRKCLQTDRRRRMTVRQALKDDPWLTNFGKLPCPFANVPKTAYDEIVGDDDNQTQVSSTDRAERERRARRQFMKDLERSQQVENEVKRTLIYHPINPSTYFTVIPTKHNSTSTTQSQQQQQQQHQHHHHHHYFHQHHYHYQHQTIELLRSELLQTIKARARKLGMRSAERWESLSIRSPLSLRFKGNTGDDKKISFLQRFTKDQVYYFHLGRSTRRGSGPPSLSSSDSTSTSSVSSVDSVEHVESQQQQRLVADDRGNVIALVKQTCQLMGVSYFQETPTRLVCVMTLRDTPKKDCQHQQARENGHQQGPPRSSNVRRRTSRNSNYSTATSATTSSIGSNAEKEPHRLKRLSMPLISHLTSSMTTSFFARSKQQQRPEEEHHPVVTRSQNKDGMAIFTIEFEVRSPNSSLVALRFSKQHGSTTVFKMACGWVTGVIGLNH